MGRKSSLLFALVAPLALAVLMSGCASVSSSSFPVAPSSAPASSPSSSPVVSAKPTAPTVTLPLVVCPTTSGLASTPGPKSLPAVVNVSVAGGASTTGLAVYTDDQGTMKLLGPAGWACSAQYGADGSGGVVVSPSGENVPPNWGAGWNLPAGSSVRAIIGFQTGGCANCRDALACALFSTAAKSFKTDFGRPCPGVRPGAETTQQVNPDIVAFDDPAGVVGDGIPSGGKYAANGVLTYYSGSQNGSWLETCTMPDASRHLCTATLDYFLGAYGTRLPEVALT